MRSLILLLAITLSAAVQAYQPKEGVDYYDIKPTPPVGQGDEVKVTEFFMYTCPHCNHLEPKLKEWVDRLPPNVEFEHIPAMFGGSANLHGRTFFALQAIGEADRLHEKFFHAIHDQKRRLRTRGDIENFLAQNGVDLDKFREAFDSFAVQTKVNRAAALMRRYGVRSVPVLIIDGRYRVMNTAHIFDTADTLIQRVLEQRQGR